MDERRAIESGRHFEERLHPEAFRSTFLRTPREEDESERRWQEKRVAMGYDEEAHVTRAGSVTPRGGITGVLGRVTQALGIPVQSTSTKYPICLRTIVHPRSARSETRKRGAAERRKTN